jgi:hypothetical protein
VEAGIGLLGSQTEIWAQTEFAWDELDQNLEGEIGLPGSQTDE